MRPYWLRLRYFDVPVEEPVLEPMLPDVAPAGLLPGASLDVLPDALEPVLEPYWRRHWSRSSPVLPRHWLGVVEPPAAAPVSVLVLELGELIDPLLELGELVLGELVAPVLEPMLPDVLPDWAHDAPATATNAAATAVAITLTFMIESPWSVEQELQRVALQEKCLRATVCLESR